MSEDLHVARELAKELFPDAELSDEEVVRIALTYARGYREGVESERDRALAVALKKLMVETSTKPRTRSKKGR